MSPDSRLLADLKRYGYATGEITLASGGRSGWYVDASHVLLRGDRFNVYKQELRRVLEGMPDFTAVGGLTMGADPLAMLIADAAGARAFSIRKTAKQHGTERDRIVGPLQHDDRILVVDDVTTSGNSLQQTIDVLTGYTVAAALCLVDRSGNAVTHLLAQRAIPYRSVFTDQDFQ